MTNHRVSIGVFDSGHGGLDILRELMASVVGDYSYYADTRYLPYGSLEKEKIVERSIEVCDELIKTRGCDLIVVACNTATAYSIDALRQTFTIPFVGVEPYLNYVNKVAATGTFGALVTPNTHNSERFKNLKKLRDPEGKIPILALEKLAPLVEEFLVHKDREALLKELEAIFSEHLPLNWESTILGCTHYPLIAPELSQVLKTQCVSPTKAVVEQVLRLIALSKGELSQSFSYFNSKQEKWREATLTEFLG